MQAEDGVGLPEQILDSSNFQNYARFYFIFIKFNLIWSLSYFALIVLNFLEVSSDKLLMNSSSSYMYLRLSYQRKYDGKKIFHYVLYLEQKPLWCKKLATHSCNDREYFYLGQLPYLTDAECLIYEVRVQYFRHCYFYWANQRAF